LATLELFERDDVISSNRTKAAHLSAAAQSIATHPRVRNFRTTGMIWAFEIETEEPAFARHFYQTALEHELLLRPIGNTVYFMPPYVITADEMDMLVAHTLEVINALPV
jgi:adenosylmethionine-8-amino-7-oxononanoate aminotransferase